MLFLLFLVLIVDTDSAFMQSKDVNTRTVKTKKMVASMMEW
jgi:hypothetical protein